MTAWDDLPQPSTAPPRIEPDAVPDAPGEIPGSLDLFGGEVSHDNLPVLQDYQNGELITTPERAALYLDRLRELQRDLLRRKIEEAEAFIIYLMDQRGEYTLHLPGGVKAEGQTEFAAEKIEWDLGTLRRELEATGLPEDRINSVIKTVVTEKVDLSEAKRVAASSPARSAAIAAAQTRHPGKRHVQIQRDTTTKRRPS